VFTMCTEMARHDTDPCHTYSYGAGIAGPEDRFVLEVK
jgi:hypothetical protein